MTQFGLAGNRFASQFDDRVAFLDSRFTGRRFGLDSNNLRRKIEEKTGAVYLNMPEVLQYVAIGIRPGKLREDVRIALRKGSTSERSGSSLLLRPILA